MVFFYWLTKGLKRSVHASSQNGWDQQQSKYFDPTEIPVLSGEFDTGNALPGTNLPSTDTLLAGIPQHETSAIKQNGAHMTEDLEAPLSVAVRESGPFGNDPCNAASTPSHNGNCDCMVCLRVGLFPYYRYTETCRLRHCHHCSETVRWGEIQKHEKSHFGHPGNYTCAEVYCQFRTSRWPDLKRHYAGKHCKNPQKHSCQVIGCKYSGENGFTRADKLKSHVKNVHKGNTVPSHAMRSIKPAVLKGKASGSEGLGSY